MSSARDIVVAYIDAIESQDFAKARTFLADEGFEYHGPNTHFTKADDFVAFLFGMGSIQKSIDTRRVIAERDEVCALLDYQTYFDLIGDVRVAMWARVAAGRIQKLELFYNAAVVENMLSVDGHLPFQS